MSGAGSAYDAHATARMVAEAPKAAAGERSPFARDRARVLHSAALRRLAAKTQVVGIGVDDFPRTRLTHSLECAQVGRELAVALGADPDAVDAACLAHDLGHPPFGHNGEQALDDAAQPCGGFEGNAQSLRVLTRLEAKVEGAGLNLTRAVLDGATKYPWPKQDGPKYGVYADDLPAFTWLREGAPDGRRCIEAQIMDWADDVAYSVHDLEDGIVAGHVPLHRLRDDRDQLVDVAREHYSSEPPDALHEALDRILALETWPKGHDGSQRSLVALKRLTSGLIGRFCRAAVTATRERRGDGPLARYAADLHVPAEARAECALLKAITAHYVMFRTAAEETRAEEREVILGLVRELVVRAPDALEPALRAAYAEAADDARRLRVVIDQVASLTDTSARRWHRRLGGR